MKGYERESDRPKFFDVAVWSDFDRQVLVGRGRMTFNEMLKWRKRGYFVKILRT